MDLLASAVLVTFQIMRFLGNSVKLFGIHNV